MTEELALQLSQIQTLLETQNSYLNAIATFALAAFIFAIYKCVKAILSWFF